MKSNYIKQVLLIVTIVVLGACSEDFSEKKPTEFVDYDGATKTTENLMITLNGIHRSLYITYEDQSQAGLGGLMQQTDIAGDDVVFSNYKWVVFTGV
ncbi:hypothetical protein [Flavobacterium sp. 81]|uniref:hypothetical protein n=1 Tax=Flavobacterium sp. 81 TaxID=2135621 RepID=UPI001F3423EA|nr:hypothetical protein [Flavobacterium sp. 81]